MAGELGKAGWRAKTRGCRDLAPISSLKLPKTWLGKRGCMAQALVDH